MPVPDFFIPWGCHLLKYRIHCPKNQHAKKSDCKVFCTFTYVFDAHLLFSLLLQLPGLKSSYLSLPRAGTIGLYHHLWLIQKGYSTVIHFRLLGLVGSRTCLFELVKIHCWTSFQLALAFYFWKSINNVKLYNGTCNIILLYNEDPWLWNWGVRQISVLEKGCQRLGPFLEQEVKFQVQSRKHRTQ